VRLFKARSSGPGVITMGSEFISRSFIFQLPYFIDGDVKLTQTMAVNTWKVANKTLTCIIFQKNKTSIPVRNTSAAVFFSFFLFFFFLFFFATIHE